MLSGDFMHIHLLGICGTFMGGIALLAKELGFKVTGSDHNIYPPMSTQLQDMGIAIELGYEKLSSSSYQQMIVGNVMRRGMPVIETMLNEGRFYTSGPEWLAREILQTRHVLAVSGTHGKTTTSSMLAWILAFAGFEPGFLIGGIPNNFGVSARLGQGKYFVIEADEYDSAFFDKRSKFLHYRPQTLIINNIEFDHADIFSNLTEIQKQFHHLVRTVPGEGLIIYPALDKAVQEVIKMGCWSKQETIFGLEPLNNVGWTVQNAAPSFAEFEVYFKETFCGKINWSLLGNHNMLNALSAIAAARAVGVAIETAINALNQFQGVKRRLELKGVVSDIYVYDDFAHHPTAIATTLAGMRSKVGQETRIIAVVEVRSNTMRAGFHQAELSLAVEKSDVVYFFKAPDISWNIEKVWENTGKPGGVYTDILKLIQSLKGDSQKGDQVVFMSNGGFGGIHTQFLQALTF
jgi:UDP-N-acetylmuramate: L-alanyl-gamma-D-glutamyl-meso-diaminopimelate ligase